MELQQIYKKKEIVFSCFNLYTLYISFVYSEYLREYFGFHSTIIWRGTILKLPPNLHASWNVTIASIPIFSKMNGYVPSKVATFINIHTNKGNVKKILYAHFEVVKNAGLLVVFKDNNYLDIEVIRFFKKYSEAKIVLVEEGNGLYASSCGQIPVRTKLIKLVLGLPKETSYAQGQSNLWDYVICKYPDLFSKTKKREAILQQSNVFCKKYMVSFLKLFSNNQTINHDCDCIYFSQPLSEDGLVSKEQEMQGMSTIFDNIPLELHVGIKLHQREKRNKFDELVKKFPNIEILDPIFQDLPGEIMYNYSKPILLTPFSSVATNIMFQDLDAVVILLYKYFPLPEKTLSEIEKVFRGKTVLTGLEECGFRKRQLDTEKEDIVTTPVFNEIIQIVNS